MAVACGSGAMGGASAWGEAKPVFKPLSIGALEEFGSLRSGRYGNNPAFRDDWTDHFGAFVTQSVAMNAHIDFDIGLGGLFEYQKKEVVQAGWGGTQYKNFFLGPTVADFVYRSAPQGQSGISLQVGLFPYRYNPDAANLGEYLFRSGPYPTYLLNGTYAMVNSTSTYLQGLKTSFTAGNFSADVLLATETSLPALYDWSLGAVLKYQALDGLLDFGAGAYAKHLIPVQPSRTSPHIPANAYFEKGGKVWTGYVPYYQEHATFYNRIGDSATAAVWQGYADSVGAWISADAPASPSYNYYTQAGLLVMGRFSLDLKKAMPSAAGLFGAQDLKLYSEACLMGVRNYPLFYEKRFDRLPIMAGFNFPGFKLLDLISLQVEYFHSPWLNSYRQIVGENTAIPTIPQGGDAKFSQTAFNDISAHDNLAWSVLVKKRLSHGLWLSGQCARDHTRLVSVDTWAGPGVEPTEVLSSGKDWYWMAQLSAGI